MRSLTNRVAVFVLLWLVLSFGRVWAFDLEQVAEQAAALAQQPHRDRRPKVPPWMLNGSMTYDQWRDIRFRPDRALWRDRDLPFQVQLFHPGLYYDRTVALHTVEDGQVRTVPFSTRLFDYGKNDFAERIPSDIGYAGFRLHYPLKSPAYHDELIAFLGATYFRSLGRDQMYGLSARGLAIDTVEPSGEEFPVFTDFWLVTPAVRAAKVVVYALMDSASVAGAYRFDIAPGVQTVVDVEVRLFPRRAVKELGIAPLTSMFFFGENSVRRFEDFRPEVHDSDGLLLRFDSGEWLWRPLDNPPRVHSSAFRMRDPRGFGLMQRDRDFASHQDIETRSELRPSAWVEPSGDWGDGRIELVEIPTETELVDNVVAFWVSAAESKPGVPSKFAYRVFWFGDDPGRPPAGRVLATRRDRGAKKDAHRFVVDFGGGGIESIPADTPPEAVVNAAAGQSALEVLDLHVVKNPGTNGWRVTFQVKPKDEAPVELRAFLRRDGRVLSETWSNVLLP
jgi:glucans biosynthesis protein